MILYHHRAGECNDVLSWSDDNAGSVLINEYVSKEERFDSFAVRASYSNVFAKPFDCGCTVPGKL